jgi:hypothetical protein
VFLESADFGLELIEAGDDAALENISGRKGHSKK